MAVAGVTAAAAAPPGDWAPPLPGDPAVVRVFAVGPAPWSPGHRGVDLAAPAGTGVRAPAPGQVAFAGLVAGRPVLVVDHGSGVRSTFEPVTASITPGTPVPSGAPVGRLEPDGHCRPRACLHWGVLVHDRYVDPLSLLGHRRRAPVLLPLGPLPGVPARDPRIS
jgi:murein DD-endopeptidase MepM/ murein hydrolase activator NlpD